MNLDYFKRKSKSHILAKVDTLGMYDFYNSTIYLGSISPEHIEAISASAAGPIKNQGGAGLSFDQYSLLSKIFPLVIHECTHFIDATSTLWGLGHLQKMSLAYTSSGLYGGKEEDFIFAKSFHTHVRSLRLPEYYTLVDSTIERVTQWRRPEITGGIVFSSDGRISDKPILFARFSSRDGAFLARSPISMVSLLEASAMAQEIFSKLSLIGRLDEDQGAIEAAVFSTKTIEYLYNQEITEYSVCVHLVGNHINCEDVAFSFYLTAALVRVALNFPHRAFDKVLESCDLEKLFWPVEQKFIKRLQDGLRIQDPCILFFILCHALAKDIDHSAEKVKEEIVNALSILGVEEVELKTWIAEDAKYLSEEIFSRKSESVSLLGRVGMKNIDRIDIIGSYLKWHELELPPIFLADLTSWSPFASSTNEFSKINFDNFFEEMMHGERWVNNFAEGCL